ncbi:hypothetical protein V7O61_04025 [Methanolobus sp. WCC1]|uniref:hypothetical protein n=1 Tax=unclassified Methanolobus TaxID=2629569 RepID=UPI00325320D6
MNCSNCGMEINDTECCPNCVAPTTGTIVNQQTKPRGQKNPVVAALLSLFIPGLGQIYSGRLATGKVIIIGMIVLFTFAFILPRPGSGIFIGCWLFNVKDAYEKSKHGFSS